MPKLQHDNNMLGTLSNPFEWHPTICDGRGYGVYRGMGMGRIGGRKWRIEMFLQDRFNSSTRANVYHSILVNQWFISYQDLG